MTRLFIAIYFIEAGLVLMAAPWTEWWRRNYFADLLPWLRLVMASRAGQAVVVGTGVLTALVGISDLKDAIVSRFSRSTDAPVDRDPLPR